MVLPPNVFSKVAQKKQLEEVKAAGLKDLEFCPFCDFAFIPAPDDKIFRCMNAECLRETCRLCQQPSHIPFRCNEVEKEADIKMRTYIEDKMTEALVRYELYFNLTSWLGRYAYSVLFYDLKPFLKINTEKHSNFYSYHLAF